MRQTLEFGWRGGKGREHVITHMGDTHLPLCELVSGAAGKFVGEAYGMSREFDDEDEARKWVETTVQGEVGANCDGLAVAVFPKAEA